MGPSFLFSSWSYSIDSDTARIISAAVVGYIQEMGISPSLFKLMTEVGSDEIRLLSDKEQIGLSVINNGEGPTTWTIEPRWTGPSARRTTDLEGT
jgi:hypothetical protein